MLRMTTEPNETRQPTPDIAGANGHRALTPYDIYKY